MCIIPFVEATLKILSIGLGGAFGAVARYLVNISPLARLFDKFPFPTFAINVSGSFLIGFLLILLTDKMPVSEYLRMMLLVGFLGAFTTFSTFEAEIWGLVKEGNFLTALGYLLLSVVFGFVAVVAGARVAQAL